MHYYVVSNKLLIRYTLVSVLKIEVTVLLNTQNEEVYYEVP